MADFFGKGIGVAAGFDLGAAAPLDTRTVVADLDELRGHIGGGRTYEGMIIYCEADKEYYQIIKTEEEKQYPSVNDKGEPITVNLKLDYQVQEKALKDEVAAIKEAMGEGEEGKPSILDRIEAEEEALEKLQGGVEVEGSVAHTVQTAVDDIQDNTVGDLTQTGIEVKDAEGAVVEDATIAQQLAQVKDELDAEALRAAGAEQANANAIDAAEGRLDALEGLVGQPASDGVDASGLHKAVADEAARAVEAEGALQDAIDELAESVSTTVNNVIGGLTGTGLEGTTVAAQLTDAAAKIVTENKRAVEAEGALQDAIDAEAEAARAAEGKLAGRLDVIEGEGEGSIKKAVADAIDEVNADAEALEARVKANEDALAIVKGDANTAGSIAKAQADAQAYADQQITALVDSAPDAMNTLGELAQAIKDHGDVYTAYVTEVDGKLSTLKSELQSEIDADVKVVKDELDKQKDAGQEGTLAQKIAAEVTRATGAEGVLTEAVATEKGRAEGQEAAIRQELADEAAEIRGEMATDKAALQKAVADHEAAVNTVVGTAVTGVEDATEGADNSLKALIKRAVEKSNTDVAALQTNVAATIAAMEAEITAEGNLVLSVTEGLDVDGDGVGGEKVEIKSIPVPVMTSTEETAMVDFITADEVQQPTQPDNGDQSQA